jgi:CRISPR-associated protein (Cas_Cas02710)
MVNQQTERLRIARVFCIQRRMSKFDRMTRLWPILVSAVIVTLMAASHGVLGEALFKILDQGNSLVLAIYAALFLGVVAWLFWNKEWLFDKIRGHRERPKRQTFDRPLALLALMLFVMLAAAQGVVALSAGHLAAEMSREQHLTMLSFGAGVFLASTLLMWSLKDRLFSLETEVSPMHEDHHPLQAAVIILSNPSPKDSEQFNAAKSLFDTHLGKSGWEAALEELIRPHGNDEPLNFWNFQQPLRLLEAMTRTVPKAGKRRVLIFLTTQKSDARFIKAQELLSHVVSHMPAEKGAQPEIRHAHGHLIDGDEVSSNWVENNQFEKSFEIVRRVMSALRKEFEPNEIAFDTTGGTAEHSVICAVATIDSHVSFTYVNTNDYKVRRFNVRAKGIGGTE